MAVETIPILRVDTGEAVRSVADLKANIKDLKALLDGLEIGSKEYADTLVELQTNQAALKNALHDTSYETDGQTDKFEATAKAAQGLGTSYNALVRRMADLDQQFRATEDATKRANLGAEIKAINAQLKKFDEDRGKYGRNVGNYKSAIDGLSGAFRATAGSAGAVISPVASVTSGLKALSDTPAIAVLGLLANALTKVIGGLKSSEENTNKWNRALAAFKPVADSFTRTMQAVGKAVADTANWIVNLLDKWDLLNEASRQRIDLEEQNQAIIQRQRAIALENASLENEVAKLRDKAAQRDKYTARERLKYLEDAVKLEARIAKNNKDLANERLAAAEKEAKLAGNATETEERLNRLRIEAMRADTDYFNTTRRLQSQIAAARQEILRSGVDAVAAQSEEVEVATKTAIASVDSVAKSLEEADRKADEERARRGAFERETIEILTDAYAALTDSIQEELDAQLQAEWDALQEERRIKQQRVEVYQEYVGGIANLAGSLADVYAADADASEDAARKEKALRTAEAIIATISGAVSAYMNTIESVKIPAVAIPLAVINAGAVLAAGYAQVKQINAVKVGSGGGGYSGPGAVVSAPSFPAEVPAVRNVTGRGETERLNRIPKYQRALLVWSDVEAKEEERRMEIEETTW